MFNRLIVNKALKRSMVTDKNLRKAPGDPADGRDIEVSMLIHDIFGAEILKTHRKRGWHFYNRIDGKRVDLTGSETIRSSGIKKFEDIPSASDETIKYFAQEDYSAFYMRFVRLFEEAVGLKKCQSVAL
ncbi:MAG: hypothetical protein K0B37_02735 [Bacteroidales bacterium]|nr:hypothetical protein [Bacteroidales bacterium]